MRLEPEDWVIFSHVKLTSTRKKSARFRREINKIRRKMGAKGWEECSNLTGSLSLSVALYKCRRYYRDAWRLRYGWVR